MALAFDVHAGRRPGAARRRLGVHQDRDRVAPVGRRIGLHVVGGGDRGIGARGGQRLGAKLDPIIGRGSQREGGQGGDPHRATHLRLLYGGSEFPFRRIDIIGRRPRQDQSRRRPGPGGGRSARVSESLHAGCDFVHYSNRIKIEKDRRGRPMLGLMMDTPLLVSDLIRHADRHHGNAEIVSRRVEGDIHRYTYREAHARARRLAKALATLGLAQGDRVASLAWNGYRHFELYYASVRQRHGDAHHQPAALSRADRLDRQRRRRRRALRRPHLRAARGEARPGPPRSCAQSS